MPSYELIRTLSPSLPFALPPVEQIEMELTETVPEPREVRGHHEASTSVN